MKQRKKGFVRWQAITIAQLGFASNLILTFAPASLGFSVNLVKDKDFVPRCWGKHLLLASLALLSFSVLIGIWCVLNRLCDFRKTMAVARDREAWLENQIGKDEIDNRLRERRRETCKLGKRTWRLFYWQVGTFTSGVVVLMMALAGCGKKLRVS